MGSGEADVTSRVTAFSRCREPGCGVNVALTGDEPRCRVHGGDPDAAQYLSEAEPDGYELRPVIGDECE